MAESVLPRDNSSLDSDIPDILVPENDTGKIIDDIMDDMFSNIAYECKMFYSFMADSVATAFSQFCCNPINFYDMREAKVVLRQAKEQEARVVANEYDDYPYDVLDL